MTHYSSYINVAKYNLKSTKNLYLILKKINGLSITIINEYRRVNFLNATFDLDTGLHEPFHKPNENLKYINIGSNHPPSKMLTTSRKPNNYKSNIKNLDNRIPKHKIRLTKSKHIRINHELKKSYNRQQIKRLPPQNLVAASSTHTNRPNQKFKNHDVLWYNPVWNSNNSSNIAKQCLTALDRCFSKNGVYNKIFKRHTIKLSYANSSLDHHIHRINNRKLRRRIVGNPNNFLDMNHNSYDPPKDNVYNSNYTTNQQSNTYNIHDNHPKSNTSNSSNNELRTPSDNKTKILATKIPNRSNPSSARCTQATNIKPLFSC
ncbi:GATA zinc finger domain-containing protein 14-like [Octopus bimaculoides]|uniref:GATA zinc finger domain-containing protein 14-like n=1 Tax=Octopus bimaculoides TaxID=37653 RepID=UPI00071E3607|nr:GATA zinc finger domain-containing protein 14-like [Octopus bimaculoides]|eukprot:XP_014780823.1 PREDICTED: GATA zinc finger domain-containing protein 14-like [Octopus bimaculoides]